MKRMSCTGRTMGAVLACAIILAPPSCAEEPGAPIQQPHAPQPKVQAPKTPEPKTEDPTLQEPKAQRPKSQDPRAQESKAPASKSEEPTSPAPKSEGPGNMPVGSLILTTKLALMADQRLFHYPIEVESKGQEVMLAGKVSNEAEKQAAAEIAQKLEGVKSVVNKLEVVKDLHQDMARKGDQIITEYVKERFKKSKTLESAGFDVKTENGVVELSGKTRFQVIALEAAEAARQIPGVKAVKTDAVRLEGAE